MVRAVEDAPRGLDAVDALLVLRLFALDHFPETPAVQPLGNRAGGYVHERGGHVGVFAQGVGRRAGPGHPFPAHDEGRLQPRVVAGPLGERELVSLLAGEDEDGVVVQPVFFQQGVDAADVGVELVDLGQIIHI